jgi:hypothetical protein
MPLTLASGRYSRMRACPFTSRGKAGARVQSGPPCELLREWPARRGRCRRRRNRTARSPLGAGSYVWAAFTQAVGRGRRAPGFRDRHDMAFSGAEQ